MDIHQAYQDRTQQRKRAEAISAFVNAEKIRDEKDPEKRASQAVTNGYYSQNEVLAFTQMRNTVYAIGRRVGFDQMAESYMTGPIARAVDYLERGGFPREKGKHAVSPVKSADNISRAKEIAGIFKEMVKGKTMYEALVVFERKTDEKVRDMSDADRYDADQASRQKKIQITQGKERKALSAQSARMQVHFPDKQAEVI